VTTVRNAAATLRGHDRPPRPLPVVRFLRAHPVRAAAAAASGIAVGILGWGVALLVQRVVDRSGGLSGLLLLALAVVGVLVLRGVLSLFRRSVQVRLARGIESSLADRFLDHVTRLEMPCYDRYHSGDLLNRLRGVEVLRNAFEDRFLGATFDAVLVLIAALVIARTSPMLAAVATVGAAIPAALIVAVRESLKRSFETMRRIDGDLSNNCMDALQGIRDIRLREGEPWIRERMKSAYRSFQDFRIAHMMKLTRLGAGTVFVSSLTGVVVLVAGASLVEASRLTQGQLMFAFTMAGTMLGPLEQLASTWIAFDEASVAYTRFDEILSLPAEARAEPRGAEPPVGGAVTFDRVTFGYSPDRPLFRQLSFDIPAGSSVSIVGESGAGKSTLLSLLAGLYAPDGGRILIDGRDLRAVGPAAARKAIGVVLQNPHLFHATVEENIRIGCWGASSEDVRRAARLAKADEFIRKLPEGYATPVHR